MWKSIIIFNALFLSAALVSVSGQAGTSFGTGSLVTISATPIVTPSPDVVATMVYLTFPPGDIGADPHFHPGPLVGYVIEGEFLFQMKSGEPMIIPAGSSFHENDGDIHVWGGNASNTTVCKVVATLMGRPGEPVLTWALDYKRTDTREEVLAKIAAKTKV